MQLQYALKALNYFFTAIFALEAFFKVYALGLQRFLHDRFGLIFCDFKLKSSHRWNKLDTLIVVLSVAGILFEGLNTLLKLLEKLLIFKNSKHLSCQ